ncbi:MAG: hypothetical protein ACP5F1_06590, partial [Thermoplasmata archaeon]
YEKKKIGVEELREAYEDEEKSWIEFQKGLSYVSDPLITWNDIFRPFTLNMENVEPGPLTRYLETNTFIRVPTIKGEPEIKLSILDMKNDYGINFILNRENKILLPGPYSFIKFSINRSGIPEEKLLEKISEIIFSQAKFFNYVEFKEPLIQSIEDLKKVSEIYSTANANGYVFTNIETQNFIDFPLGYAVRTKNFSDVNESIIVELIDVFSTRIENLDIPDISITTNESLEFLPFNISKKKIEIMKKLLEVK